MKQVFKIKVFKETDRQSVAAILVANGYIVWQGKEAKSAKRRSFDYLIYYMEPDNDQSEAKDTGGCDDD